MPTREDCLLALGYDTKGHEGFNVAVAESAQDGDDTNLTDGVGCLQAVAKTVSWTGIVKGTKPGVNCLQKGVKSRLQGRFRGRCRGKPQ